jgi:hypothetical protein
MAAYFLASALFVASKPQEAFQAVPLALFGLFLVRRTRGGARAAGVLLAASVLAVGAALVAATRSGFQQGALYKLVFFELLPRSPDPAGDLRALGLPPEDIRYSGTTNYERDSPFRDPAVRERLFSRISYPSLARFYATHPNRAARELALGVRAAWDLRAGFGNFEKSAGFKPRAHSAAYSAWRRWRLRAIPFGGLLLVVLFGGNAILALSAPLPSAARAAIGALVAGGILAYGVCTLASAHIDLARKLYVFHAVTDLLIAADVALAAAAVTARR